jgi:hypothetical protein
MRFMGKITLISALGILMVSISFNVAPAQQHNFHAIVEQNGTVVLCLSRGDLLFSDRCAVTGRLMIVQPVREGTVVWRSVIGTVVMENEAPQNPDCALGRAKWDSKTERATSSGKRIRKVEPAEVLARLDKTLPERASLAESDITAFALDLDNDGIDEIVFRASNLQRVIDLHEKTREPYPYVVTGGILVSKSSFPATFFFENGTYSGGTDTIGQVQFKGVVPIAPGTGEIALLIKAGDGLASSQDLIRFRGSVQRIETIEFRCH